MLILLIHGPKLGLVSNFFFQYFHYLSSLPFYNKLKRSFFLFSDNYNETESNGWYCALLSATGIQYLLSIAGVVLLYIYYDCALNKFFITTNLVLCIIVSILSILPQVQDRFPRSGLLQSSVVTLYAVYLTWSALSNNPDPKCHTEFHVDSNNKVSSRIRFSQVRKILISLNLFHRSLLTAPVLLV